jgi:hypothetical protein
MEVATWAAAAKHIALAQAQALAVFEHQQLFGRIDRGVAVRANAPAAAMPEPRRHVENAVAKIGFGGGADAGHGSAAGRACIFLGRHVRGMDQAPARIDGRMLEQPLHGALTAPGQAVIHLLGLLGDMDVHDRLGQHGMQACERGLQAVRRHGAQRVRSQAQSGLLRPGRGLQLLQQAEHIVRAANEAGLILARRQPPKPLV